MKKRKLKIALDYDETFTEDRELWELFVYAALNRGHEVVFVTYRASTGDNTDIVVDTSRLGIDVIYTNGLQKSTKYIADIWIDDTPVLIPKYTDLIGMARGCEINGDTQ